MYTTQFFFLFCLSRSFFIHSFPFFPLFFFLVAAAGAIMLAMCLFNSRLHASCYGVRTKLAAFSQIKNHSICSCRMIRDYIVAIQAPPAASQSQSLTGDCDSRMNHFFPLSGPSRTTHTTAHPDSLSQSSSSCFCSYV